MNELLRLIDEDDTISREDKEVLWFVIEQINYGQRVFISSGETGLDELFESWIGLKRDDETGKSIENENGDQTLEITSAVQVPFGQTYYTRADVTNMNVVLDNMKELIPFYKRLVEQKNSER